MAAAGDLRGSAPILSAKDVLLEVRDDVKAMRGEFVSLSSKVDVLTSQHLDERVTRTEEFMWRVAGLGAVGAMLGALAALASLGRWLG